MKCLSHLLTSAGLAFLISSCAAPGGGGGGVTGAETQLGPHSAEKFVLATHTGSRTLNEADPNYIRTIALVLKVEQKMVGGQQEITASASCHRDGPTGALVSIDGLNVHVTQPIDFSTKPRKTGEARTTNTVPAPGGKFRTVTAEGSINSADYTAANVSLTIPGDQH